jgi:8-oxo-dGTP diphosphatase
MHDPPRQQGFGAGPHRSNWPGVAFPGGHVEKGESFTDTVIREVQEETGLTISSPRLCGITD